jgi:hypothetical protein
VDLHDLPACPVADRNREWVGHERPGAGEDPVRIAAYARTFTATAPGDCFTAREMSLPVPASAAGADVDVLEAVNVVLLGGKLLVPDIVIVAAEAADQAATGFLMMPSGGVARDGISRAPH